MSKTKITTIFAMLFIGTQAIYGQFVEMSTGTGISNKIQCLDGYTCYLGGIQGELLKTTDGVNWIDLNIGASDVEFLQCFGKDTCLVGSSDGLYKTFDGGQIWNSIPLSMNFGATYFVNSIVGFNQVAQGEIYKTIDGGQNWTWINTMPNEVGSINSIYFLNEQSGIIVTQNFTEIAIYKTIDGAQNWIKVFQKAYTTPSLTLNDIQMVTANIGFACGMQGMILKTIDGGNNWSELNNPNKDQLLNYVALDFINTNSGYVVGTQGKIVKTIDGGQNWVEENVTITANKDVSVASLDTTYVAVGASAKVLKNINSNLSLKISEISMENGKIYPNPSNNHLTIELKQIQANTKLVIYDLLGKPVSQFELSGKTNVIQNLNLIDGSYLFQVIQDAEILSNGTLIIN